MIGKRMRTGTDQPEARSRTLVAAINILQMGELW
jgi:hypothetical protein